MGILFVKVNKTYRPDMTDREIQRISTGWWKIANSGKIFIY